MRRRFQIEWALVALVATVLITLATAERWTRAVDDLIYDLAMQMAPARADPGILIVAIDEPSLAALGRWPWPRTLQAKALDALSAAGPQSVTMDVLLTEPGVPTQDAALARAMQGIGRLYLPVQFVVPGRDGHAFDRFAPAPVLADAATGLGHANTLIDPNGSVRSASLCFKPDARGEALPHIAALAAGTVMAAGCATPRRLRFALPESFATISFVSVLRGEVPPALIAGRRVLIGMTAQGLGDRYPVPSAASGNMPGVEINANILNAQIGQLWVRQPGLAAALLAALLPGWLLLLAFWRLRPRTVIVLVAGLVLLVLGGSVAALLAGIWLPPGPALLGLVLIYPLWGWRRLQATSDYLAHELGEISTQDALPIGPRRSVYADVVTSQSDQLHDAINQLRDLRRFIGDTLAGLPDPALVSDPDGRIVLTNAAANAAFGKAMGAGNVNAVLTQIARPASRGALADYLAAPGSEPLEFTALDGRSFVLRRAPIISADGQQRGHVDYLTDITAMAEAREQREVMLQLLSHDMRGPQAAILAMVADDTQAVDRTRIARHARHTLTLADSFVDLARMQERPFAPEPVIAADLASEAADSLWPIASQRHVRISIVDDSDCAFITGERESLFRALVNLIDNAVKYSPDGGTVTVAVLPGAAGQLIVRISDTGRGINPAILPHLFQRFASGRDGTSAVNGIGLGLNYVAAVVARHGGTIEGRNGVDGGAVFTLTLPLEA